MEAARPPAWPSVSRIASLFTTQPPGPKDKEQQERRPVLLQRSGSRVNRFSDARARFQAAEAGGACRGALPAPEPRSPGRRPPSPGCRTEALIRSFSQLAGSPGHGGPGHWGRRSLPEGLGPWAAEKENPVDQLCSPGWSPLPACCRPVARVAPGGTVQHTNPPQCPVSARSRRPRAR